MNSSSLPDTYRQIVEINRTTPGSVDQYWFGRCGAGPRLDLIRERFLKQVLMAALCEKAGISCGFQQGVTLGHGSIYDPAGGGQAKEELHPFTDAAWQVGRDGKRLLMFCPRSPEVLRYEENYAAILGETLKPASFWLDDDLRLGFYKPDGCFCPRCVAAFGAKVGQSLTREELVARLFGSAAREPLRRAWLDFTAESLAVYGAAARRGMNRTNPNCLVAYQSVYPLTLETGRDYVPLLRALSEGGKYPTAIRVGSGCYEEKLEEIVEKMHGVVFESERIRRSGLNLASVSYEQENYRRQVLHKTPEAIAVESALALACGCDSLTEYYFDEKQPEPLSYYREFAETMAAWRPYYERLSKIARETSMGGVARFIGSDFDLIPKRTLASASDMKLAGLGIPVTVAASGTRLFYVNEDSLAEWGANDVARLLERSSAGLVDKACAKRFFEVGGEQAKAALAEKRFAFYDFSVIAPKGYKDFPRHQDREALLDAFDALAGEKLPVRVERIHPLYVYPRVNGSNRVVAVTFYNGAAGALHPTRVRVRRPAGTRLVWMRPEEGETVLEGVQKGDEVAVVIPKLPARQVGTLFLEALPDTAWTPSRPRVRHAPIKLPPCGVLVGNAIYNAGWGFHSFAGPVLTHWKSYTKSPLELTELTVKENQGNLIQYWWAASWNRYYNHPQSRAHYLGFEDLGIRIPPPNWTNLTNLTLSEFPEFARYADRAGYGMDKCFRRCEELGLYSMMIYLPSDANTKYTKRFKDYPHYLGYDVGERFGFHCDPAAAKRKDAVRLDVLAKDFATKVAAHIDENVRKGYGRISATSGNFHMDYEVAAGLDFTLFEDCTAELNLMSAFSRGLMRQYDLELWGSHVADEHYQWLPWTNPHRGETCRAAMLMKYMAGAKVIVQESGAWDNQTTMAVAPMKDTPRLPYPFDAKLTPQQIQPYAKEAVRTMHLIDDTSDFCRRYRKIMSDFYDYVKANPEPAGQPETTIALVKGNYDLSAFGGEFDPNLAIAGLSKVAERDPRWYNGAPERGWQAAMDVFFPTPQGIFGTKDKNLRFTGTPWGQVDVISFAFDQVSPEFLLKNYRLLIFVGWNTCSSKQYAILREYVEKGGKLFIALPQLSTDVTRNDRDYKVSDLVGRGDLSALCGVRVKGRGKPFYWATGTEWKPNRWGLSFERRFGVFYAPAGDIEITARDTETLVLDHEALQPVLLRNKIGKGEVYFMNTWFYPGYYTADQGTGAKDNENLVSFIWRRLAKENRASVYMTEVGADEPGDECTFVNLSHFPSTGTTMLFNVDFARPHTVELHRNGKVQRITLAPSELRRL